MSLPIVLDTTVLTNFPSVKCTALVLHLWSTACTTAEAIAEYQNSVSLGCVSAQAWSALPIVSLSEVEFALAASRVKISATVLCALPAALNSNRTDY
jgi:hypothetical protein